MEAFLYSHSIWVWETVDDMLESTKRKKVSGINKPRKRRKRDKPPADCGDGRVDCKSRDPSQQPGGRDARGVANEEEVEQAKDRNAFVPGRRSDKEAEGDSKVSAAAELEAIKTSINGCSGFHGYQKVDTKIGACPTCKKDTLLCNANPLSRGPQRSSCGGGRGELGGLGGAKALIPLMGRGDDNGTATRRDGRGDAMRRLEVS